MTASHKTSITHMNKAYNELQTQLHIKIQLKISYFCSILQTCWNVLL